ncbi:glycoside hydrolase domain-containing protein [Paenibacillus koleovorans]|uniref:glycoside hydrolase domain-containing protein n=1 Tax=Paenibacillus koleovorans TaxID=121608 RepID=UPI0013E2C400|nr:glycoside hydrolase domain-containing protein [Paenibacillus koleovorans]
MKGFDCSTPLTYEKALEFRADGFEFVCRYLVPTGFKRLTPEEATAISEAGLKIVSVFETTADRALGGRTAGLADGALAAQVAARVGQPEGSAIYYAVDFDATPSQMWTVIEYLKACAEASPAFMAGVYGSYKVMQAVGQAGASTKYWQTYAWSQGLVADFNNLYQYQNDIVVHGIAIDLDQAYGDEGWWTTKMAYQLSAEDANKVIAFLSAAYEATTVAEARDEFHRLANELRKASGQLEP